jgi:hypothetical protein
MRPLGALIMATLGYTLKYHDAAVGPGIVVQWFQAMNLYTLDHLIEDG